MLCAAVRFEWVHCMLDGTPLYVDVQAMVRGRRRVRVWSFGVLLCTGLLKDMSKEP